MNYIYVVNVGNLLTENQRLSFLDACRRWGCTYAEINNGDNPKELKFKAFEFCPDADKILILDADTIIRSDTPNIFQYDNAAVLSDHPGLPDVSTSHDLSLILRKYPVLLVQNFNSGVLLLSDKRILGYAEEIHHHVPGRIGLDQMPINYALAHYKVSVTQLDYGWNFRGPQFPDPMIAYIYHYAGQPDRFNRCGKHNWFHSLIPDRTKFYQLLKKYQTGAEIGIHRGLFSESILSQWDGCLFLVDLWKQQSREVYQSVTCNQPDEIQQQVYLEMRERLKPYQQRIEIIRKESTQAARDLPKLDFVYIDANHSFEATLADLKSYYPLVKPGGLIAGHDFLDGMIGGCDFGVKKAVLKFLKDKPHCLYVTNEQFPTWYFYKE